MPVSVDASPKSGAFHYGNRVPYRSNLKSAPRAESSTPSSSSSTTGTPQSVGSGRGDVTPLGVPYGGVEHDGRMPATIPKSVHPSKAVLRHTDPTMNMGYEMESSENGGGIIEGLTESLNSLKEDNRLLNAKLEAFMQSTSSSSSSSSSSRSIKGSNKIPNIARSIYDLVGKVPVFGHLLQGLLLLNVICVFIMLLPGALKESVVYPVIRYGSLTLFVIFYPVVYVFMGAVSPMLHFGGLIGDPSALIALWHPSAALGNLGTMVKLAQGSAIVKNAVSSASAASLGSASADAVSAVKCLGLTDYLPTDVLKTLKEFGVL